MPVKTVKKHPFIAKMECEAGIRGISDSELAVTMRVSESTFFRRKSNPNDLSVDELMRFAKKLKMEIVITAEGLDCRKAVT